MNDAVYHVTIVASGNGQLNKFGPMVIDLGFTHSRKF